MLEMCCIPLFRSIFFFFLPIQKYSIDAEIQPLWLLAIKGLTYLQNSPPKRCVKGPIRFHIDGELQPPARLLRPSLQSFPWLAEDMSDVLRSV